MRTRFLFFFGLILLLLLHSLHFADVLELTIGTAFAPYSLVVRANMTPLAWSAYLLILLGLLTWLDGTSYLRRYRNRFAVCWLWSVTAWCYFDAMNFYFMTDPTTGLRAWEYFNLPPRFDDRILGYLFAFGAIAPGMFLTADVLQRLGFHKLNTSRRVAAGGGSPRRRVITVAVFFLGVILSPIPIFVGTPASNLAIWVGTWALLDPINRCFGRPSILTDWFHGRWGRTLALGAGGLLCGFLWEFWNYWAVTKWIYHLPFLGSFEHYKYFEMPIPGLIGFIAFALETWAMWQTSLLLLSPFVEGEGKTLADQFHHDYACL
jgi:hypothetical protein